ncbi:GspH/FimT family pseudopilin [uncultured Neptuniibacter sp.]|uniref:GspH/FimT family pseudopilin n=1 Tax=uncultured Neptuniibacter sp. TaxID=502143 RepID=UPI00262CBB77|nr:GspH/FimT family pseudopilin [uncultured Neptuniibacter sp.]
MHTDRLLGFTLLELLIVLIIAGLAMSVVAPRFGGLLPEVQLRSETGKVVSLLRQAQSISMSRGVMIEVAVDGEHSSIQIKELGEAGTPMIPLELNAVLSSEGRGAIRFYPDGTSSGGRVELQSGQRIRVVQVNWLTGQVQSDG